MKKVMETTGAKVVVLTGAGDEGEGVVRVTGAKEVVAKATKMLEGVGIGGGRKVMVREDQVGILIGKGGGTLKKMEEETGVRLVVAERRPGFSERVVRIYGTKRQAAAAARRVKTFLDEWKSQDKDKSKDKGRIQDKDNGKDTDRSKDKDISKSKGFSDKRNHYVDMMERLDMMDD